MITQKKIKEALAAGGVPALTKLDINWETAFQTFGKAIEEFQAVFPDRFVQVRIEFLEMTDEEIAAFYSRRNN